MWSGPAVATIRNVPAGLLGGVLLALPVAVVADFPHAASPAAASTATARAASRLGIGVMSGLLRACRRAQACEWSPSVGTRTAGHCLPARTKRSKAFTEPQPHRDHASRQCPFWRYPDTFVRVARQPSRAS